MNNIAEIRSSWALRTYGAILCLIHVMTWSLWSTYFSVFMSNSKDTICWPFFNHCEISHGLPFEGWQILLACYGLLALVAAVLFFNEKHTGKAWLLLLALTLFKQILHFQDYRTMGNYHFMPFLALYAFLLLPEKKRFMPLLLVLFYVSAGWLKLSPEWLSGAALKWRPIPEFISPQLFRLVCAYVVVLELGVVWFLLSQDWRRRVFASINLLIFHAVSYYWVGAYYPATMAILLSIFPLLWWRGEEEYSFWPKPALNKFVIGVFAISQAYPWVSGRNVDLDGQARLTSLNMFTANTTCMGSFILRYRNNRTIEYSPQFLALTRRTQCDPIVYRSEMKQICRDVMRDPDFVDADVRFIVKGHFHLGFTEMVSFDDFCRSPHTVPNAREEDEIQVLRFQNSQDQESRSPLPKIIAGENGWIVAQSEKGDEIWRFRPGNLPANLKPIFTFNGRNLFIMAGTRDYRLNPETGVPIWIKGL